MSTISGVPQAPCTSTQRPVNQLSSTDSKIKNLAKTAFQKIGEFFALCISMCKSKYEVLKAKYVALRDRITSFFKTSDSSPKPSQRSRSPSPVNGRQAPPRTLVRSPSPAPSLEASPVNERPAQVSVRELTPQTGALIIFNRLQANDAVMQEMYNRSLRSLVDNNYELPSPIEAPLGTLHPFMLLPANASQPESPEATDASVNAEQVFASAISFAQTQHRYNTSPNANVDQLSQLSPKQRLEIFQQLGFVHKTANVHSASAEGQTKQSSGSKVPAYMFGAGAAVMAGAAAMKANPELVNQIASGATTAAQSAAKFAQPVLARGLDAAANGVQNAATAVQNGAKMLAEAVAAHARFNNGGCEIEFDMG